MWEVLNSTDYACAGTFQRDSNGHEHWCIAIRATFEVDPDGGVRTAPKQIPVSLVPRFAGEGNEILLADDDIIPFVPVTDILIRGLATPAITEPRPSPLSVEIGAVRKQALLYPPRRAGVLRGSWHMLEVAPQQPASLGWESSFGGSLPGSPENQPPENPQGTGSWLRAPQLFEDGTEIDLPRIEGLGMDCARAPDRSRSVGFGPIPRWWYDRVILAGRFDDDWRDNRAPAMPKDYDAHFLCSAPRDQWPESHLSGGEPVCLRGFTENRDWRLRLPQALFRVETRLGTELVSLPTQLVRIDLWPSDDLVSMLWLATLACNGRDHMIGTSRVSLRQLSGVAQ